MIPIIAFYEKQIPTHDIHHAPDSKENERSIVFAPKTKAYIFCTPAHHILLALGQYESKGYEGMAGWLDAATGIAIQLQSRAIPHLATPQKAAAARTSGGMLDAATGRLVSIASPGSAFAGIDATGFEDRHAVAPYCAYRCSIRHALAKMPAGSDMESQLVCAVVIQHHHPASHDIRHLPRLFSQMPDVAPMGTMVLDKVDRLLDAAEFGKSPMGTMVPDKGYDAEPVHKRIRDKSILSMIPARGENAVGSTGGRYRRQMRREFDATACHQRSKAGTVFSVVKRGFGSEIKSQRDAMKTKELLCRVLACNCHRMCIISCLVLFMISRKPKISNVFNIFETNDNMSTTLQKKTYTVVITKDLEEGGFVGRCDELHAVSEGDTFGEIMENMKEAVDLAAEESGNPTEFNMLVIEQ